MCLTSKVHFNQYKTIPVDKIEPVSIPKVWFNAEWTKGCPGSSVSTSNVWFLNEMGQTWNPDKIVSIL